MHLLSAGRIELHVHLQVSDPVHRLFGVLLKPSDLAADLLDNALHLRDVAAEQLVVGRHARRGLRRAGLSSLGGSRGGRLELDHLPLQLPMSLIEPLRHLVELRAQLLVVLQVTRLDRLQRGPDVRRELLNLRGVQVARGLQRVDPRDQLVQQLPVVVHAVRDVLREVLVAGLERRQVVEPGGEVLLRHQAVARAGDLDAVAVHRALRVRGQPSRRRILRRGRRWGRHSLRCTRCPSHCGHHFRKITLLPLLRHGCLR